MKRSVPHAIRPLAVLLAAGALAGLASADVGAQSGAAAAQDTSLRLRAATVDTSTPRPSAALADLARTAEADDVFILQFDGPMMPARRRAILDAGVALGDYLPPNAWLARISGADGAALAALDFIRWHAPFDPSWKIDPEVGTRAYASPERQTMRAAGREALVVTLFEGADEARAAQSILKIPGAVLAGSSVVGGNAELRIHADLATVEAIASLADVQFIEPAGEIDVRNSSSRWLVQSTTMNATPLYDAGLHGEGQIVGLLDLWLDHVHCAFDDPAHDIGPDHRKILAYNTFFADTFHGTRVGCTLAGDAGVDDDTRGIAYASRIVFNRLPMISETSVVDSLTLHHTQGARMHNNSWGDENTTSYNGLARGFDSFAWTNEFSLSVIGVSNGSVIKNPENAKNILAVGATQDAPDENIHCFGGAGPTDDGRRKPEIYAPGCDVVSADFLSLCGTNTSGGTSYAAPAVTGVGALIRQYFLEGFYDDGVADGSSGFEPSGALVKAVLLNSTLDMTDVAGFPSNLEGWGRLVADEALHFAGDARRLLVEDVLNAEGLSTGAQNESVFNVDASLEELRVTLVWTEPPAAAGAAAATINDLDLEVVSPVGQVYLGNVFIGGLSVTGGSKDPINNVEQVRVRMPMTGEWTVRVAGAVVNESTQGYAWAIAGEVSEVTDCVCDIDGGGLVDSGDFFAFISAFVAGDADINGDTITDSSDFFDFIACFVSGC